MTRKSWLEPGNKQKKFFVTQWYQDVILNVTRENYVFESHPSSIKNDFFDAFFNRILFISIGVFFFFRCNMIVSKLIIYIGSVEVVMFLPY